MLAVESGGETSAKIAHVISPAASANGHDLPGSIRELEHSPVTGGPVVPRGGRGFGEKVKS